MKNMKTKQKSNKKLLSILMLSLFGISLVIAGGYYVLYASTFSVNNIDGMGSYSETIEGDYEWGDVIVGSAINLENDLENNRVLTISNNAPSKIATEYKSTLELTKKDVDFGNEPWNILSEKVQIEYTLVGDEFSAEVTDDNEETGYVLVYYSDVIDRFDNPQSAIKVENISGNLPYTDDKNADTYNYCSTGEYNTCNGAKIWYVPESALTDNNDGSWAIDWSKADDFYFESKLIQYNSDGEITLYSGDTLEIIPEFTPNEYAEGEYTVTTIVA